MGRGTDPNLEKKATPQASEILQFAPGVKSGYSRGNFTASTIPSWEVRRLAADVLGGIRSKRAYEAIPAAVDSLTKHLADEEPAVRVSAAAALTAVSPKLESALPLVEKSSLAMPNRAFDLGRARLVGENRSRSEGFDPGPHRGVGRSRIPGADRRRTRIRGNGSGGRRGFFSRRRAGA